MPGEYVPQDFLDLYRSLRAEVNDLKRKVALGQPTVPAGLLTRASAALAAGGIIPFGAGDVVSLKGGVTFVDAEDALQVPVSGQYEAFAFISFSASATGMRQGIVQYNNGSGYTSSNVAFLLGTVTTGNSFVNAFSGPLLLDANARVRLFQNQTSGGSLNVGAQLYLVRRQSL